MTSTQASDTTSPQDIIAGQVRRSVNASRDARGSIHDDATASKLGFRGGTVAGSIHMELFPPLLLEAFGQGWFERGTLSLYFINATTDREAVQAFLTRPAQASTDAQVDAWVNRDDGMRVAEGTASVGSPSEPTALLRRPLDRFEAGELRLLAGVEPGRKFDPVEVRLATATQAERLGHITENLPWYSEPSPWGNSIATPAAMVQMLYAKSVQTLRGNLGPAVGLFGAIELRNINGPVQVETNYTVNGHVVAVGQSPKTEYMWFETQMDDTSGKRIAEMRMLLRWMKASSDRYPELQKQA